MVLMAVKIVNSQKRIVNSFQPETSAGQAESLRLAYTFSAGRICIEA
jgi:hypothetical protein